MSKVTDDDNNPYTVGNTTATTIDSLAFAVGTDLSCYGIAVEIAIRLDTSYGTTAFADGWLHHRRGQIAQ